MVNANEVRLGNWFYHHKRGNCQVAGFQKDWIAIADEEIIFVGVDECEGIALTATVLEECGFIKVPRVKNAWWTHILPKGIMTIKKADVGFEIHFVSSVPVVEKILYLHQLQNLYFYFTGSELSFEPGRVVT